MKNKLKNAIMLAILATAMIACSGGSGGSSNQNIQLPEPDVLDVSYSSASAKTSPFLSALNGVAKEILPKDSSFFGVISGLGFGLAFTNLFTSAPLGFPQVMSKLNDISNQLTQIQGQVTAELGLDQNIVSTLDKLALNTSATNLKTSTKQIYDQYTNISNQYGQYVDEGVFGNVSYLNAINDMYSYASAHCNESSILSILDSSYNKITPGSTAMSFFSSFPSTYWSTYSQEKVIFITDMIPYFLADVESSGKYYHRDVGVFFNYFNNTLLRLASFLYASVDELRAMQLADAAYYYACPGKATYVSSNSFSNMNWTKAMQNGAESNNDFPSPSSESSTNLTSYRVVAKRIYEYYNYNFKNATSSGLMNYVESYLKPYTNADMTNLINNNIFVSSGNVVLESTTFDNNASVSSIPNIINNCSISSFNIESDSFVHVKANCLVASNNLGFSYRKLLHKIPYNLNGTNTQITSTYGFNNLYFESNQVFLMSKTTNLNVPVLLGNSSYMNTESAIEISYASNEAGSGSPTTNVIVNVESDIYVYASPWSNSPITEASCGILPNASYTRAICGGADYLATLKTNGYNTNFNIDSMANLAKNNIFSHYQGNYTTQVYYAASYKGHLFYIQYLMSGNYRNQAGSNIWEMYSGQLYASLACMTSDCTATPSSTIQQLTWGDGTVIQLNSSSYGNANIQVVSPPTTSNLVTRKLFQFESDSQIITWMESPTQLHHKAYLNGRIKYTLKAGIESTPIFVSKNYAYRLAYIANGSSGSLQIQSNNNDGSWSTTATVATAPNGATDLYLNYGDIMLVKSSITGGHFVESMVWSVSQQYRANNLYWAPDIYAEAMVTNHGHLNIYALDANNQAGVSGTSPDDTNYSRMLWSSSNFPWSAVNHGTLLQPQGSYTQTCSSVNWAQPILSATCLNSYAKVTSTTLNYYSCARNSTVSNQNGTLTCDTANKSRL